MESIIIGKWLEYLHVFGIKFNKVIDRFVIENNLEMFFKRIENPLTSVFTPIDVDFPRKASYISEYCGSCFDCFLFRKPYEYD